MAEKFITGKIDGEKFSAFILSNKPPCNNKEEHQWDGPEIMTFHNDERILTRIEFDVLPENEKEQLNQASGECSCSKCGIGYMSYDNPYLSDI